MSKIQITYTFETEAELLSHIARIQVKPCGSPQMGDGKSGGVGSNGRIHADDLPSAGRDAQVTNNEVQPKNGIVHTNPTSAPVGNLTPIPFGLPQESTPAHSSAAAGQAPIAPAAPSSTIVAPPAPPAPAPLSAPAAAALTGTATPPPPVAGAELDKHGLPWDGRIHATSKGNPPPKNADGSWRVKKNLDAATKNSVEAELRALLALNAGAAPQAPAAPPAPPAPLASMGGTVAPTTSANPMGELMAKLAPLFAAGKLTYAQCDAVVQRHGVQNLTQLILTPNLVPSVEADLMALVA